ncbi:hypothetical protein BBO99_00008579 [Phytophthora kernoviae]|uniref:TFIIS N-terminal domain-containing protein n=2 Tax=Phytophthora kernoviae TaxID=325452 RepID=A0A421GF12_9STRA|nr:hypothetical protein G195_010322 [Phytophthora kernoviae 00238/432]KAG2510918.1 hypothetical protein JM16_008348 [Phytophthora kernoviae]KAG2514240.1 hypothetical protein JM18_008280 [Phytophthora kernoviae]RLN06479.1 hypothetical protein BBI17_008588 [Phytophthora kernoviae]RLN75038.1 hypothetical protein BBO99_00008579 [Phytophthora kernoviae]
MADVEIVPNSVGWYILEGFPWWPVYICDVFKLRPNLHLLGNGHKKILKKAKDFPKDFIVVYYFGSHDFSLVSLKKGVLRPWDCAQKDSFLKGHPQHLSKKKGVMEELLVSIQEVEEYLSQPEDIRLPQHMVPSDLDPTLEPPPPELVPQEMDQDMEDMEDAEDEQDDEAPEEEGLDSDIEKEKKRKKEKNKTPKDKKEKKKSPKDKNDKKKEKKSRKTKSKDKDEQAGEAKKRKKVDDSAGHGETSPSKVTKTSTDTDVKSEPAAVMAEVVEKKPPPENLSSEQLSIMLEKEIRWILVNCQFEEMTTKTVRKLLEDRLKMDLRHHKASIKEGVARVIASMEEEDAVDTASAAVDEFAPAPAAGPTTPDEPTEASAKVEGNDVEAAISDAPAAKQEAVVSADELALEKAAKEKEKTKKQLQAAAKDLALDLEPNIMDALSSLKNLDTVDKDTLTASGLQPKLVQLRAHRSSNISELVSLLVKKWNVEDLVPAPKPITKEEILDLKAKLENSETSHDELFACLNQLAKMPLTISHLKKTEIPRVVSSLRQHGNDKVSSKAHHLRQTWMKLMKSDNAASNDPLKALKSLNRILEQRSDGASDHSKQLAALEQLHNMSLRTQDIIDSKVGVSVSKLRKSSNDKVAKMAKKLRKKWQAEANA